MTEAEYDRKLEELDRLLNDPDVPMQPARVWTLLAEISHRDLAGVMPEVPTEAGTTGFAAQRQSYSNHDRRAAIRNSRLPSGPVIGLGSTPRTDQPGRADHHDTTVSQTA